MSEVHRLELLNERGKTHGSFEQNAERSQAIKALFRQWGYDELCVVHKEALDMIALKLSRILSGHAMHKDHFRDIAGYATLAMEVCDED